ncbi:MAG: EAL domain-containing protein [Gallionella sp.]|nr:EAL domain-containing protein [Gallionella sp.]
MINKNKAPFASLPDPALRELAERALHERAGMSPERSMLLQDAQLMIHELGVHQIELEMQNDELRRVQVELGAARARYFDLYDLAPVGYCTVSEQGLILHVNVAAATLLGIFRGDLPRAITGFILGKDQDIYYLYHKRLLETNESQSCELRMVKNDGTPFWAQLTATVAQHVSTGEEQLSSASDNVGALGAGGARELRIMLSDITVRHLTEEKNQRLTQLYAALSQCNEAIVRCASEEELFSQICRIAVLSGSMKMAWIGLIDEASRQLLPVASFGEGTEDLVDISLTVGEPAASCDSVSVAIRENQPFWGCDFPDEPGCDFGQGEMAALPLHRNGAVIGAFILYAYKANTFDEAVRNLLVGMTRDISFALDNFAHNAERRRADEKIQLLAHFDQLTGLPNHALFTDRINLAVSMARRSSEPLAMLFLDLDHFKHINDTLGHRIGDAVLVEVAMRLKSAIRDEDTVSRQGGDEFILVLPDTDADGAAHVAQKLLDIVAHACQIEQSEMNVTASVGIAMYPDDGLDFDMLFRCADVAMYRAKHDGRNNYRFFTQEMQAHSARTLQLENALRHALERDQLRLHYQPQVSLRDGRVIGAEALLRWQHPELGAVSPAEFISIAESSGQIIAIGEWVLKTAINQMKRWIANGLAPMIVAVNLSAVQFRQPRLPELVTRLLDEARLPAQYLELELTEGIAMEDPLGAIAIMNDLHERGIQMSIDDFGTGYSSLSYLKKFKVYKLKIDQSFVRDVTESSEDRAIVSAIINMASSLGMQTIAEGVETAGQLEFLREQGCGEVQGYYFSKPLSANQFEAYLRQQSLSLNPQVTQIGTD